MLETMKEIDEVDNPFEGIADHGLTGGEFDNYEKSGKAIIKIMEINNKLKVNLLDTPYRIHLNFEKKIIFNNKSLENHELIKSVTFNKKNKLGIQVSTQLEKLEPPGHNLTRRGAKHSLAKK